MSYNFINLMSLCPCSYCVKCLCPYLCFLGHHPLCRRHHRSLYILVCGLMSYLPVFVVAFLLRPITHKEEGSIDTHIS